ncbi:hypothetical protein ACWGUN_07800 [Streptomyces koyangensis]
MTPRPRAGRALSPTPYFLPGAFRNGNQSAAVAPIRQERQCM